MPPALGRASGLAAPTSRSDLTDPTLASPTTPPPPPALPPADGLCWLVDPLRASIAGLLPPQAAKLSCLASLCLLVGQAYGLRGIGPWCSHQLGEKVVLCRSSPTRAAWSARDTLSVIAERYAPPCQTLRKGEPETGQLRTITTVEGDTLKPGLAGPVNGTTVDTLRNLATRNCFALIGHLVAERATMRPCSLSSMTPQTTLRSTTCRI